MPDGRGGYGTDTRSRIIRLCETHWPNFARNCSGFAKAVAKDLNISLDGQANDIFEQIQTTAWQSLGRGAHAAKIAGLVAAQDGKFVIGASRGSPNGHVAIIVDYNSERERSIAYWGMLPTSRHPDAIGREYDVVTQSWTQTHLESVIFACISVPSLS